MAPSMVLSRDASRWSASRQAPRINLAVQIAKTTGEKVIQAVRGRPPCNDLVEDGAPAGTSRRRRQRILQAVVDGLPGRAGRPDAGARIRFHPNRIVELAQEFQARAVVLDYVVRTYWIAASAA